MEEKIVEWINGLQSNSTEYINECNQCLYQFLQDPQNLMILINILRQSDDMYIIKSCLHIIRSSLNKISNEITSEYALELLSDILECFSDVSDYFLLRFYKSLIKYLITLSGDEEYPDILINFFLANEQTNQFSSIIILYIITSTVEFGESYEGISKKFLSYCYQFLPVILSIEDNIFKAYLLSLTLVSLQSCALINKSEKIDINIIKPFVNLFSDPTISFTIYSKLWNSVASIFVSFNELNSHEALLIVLIKSSLTIPNPNYFYCSSLSFLPYIKEKIIPFTKVKFFISCEITVLVKLNNDFDNIQFENEILSSVFSAYNSEEEIKEIFEHVQQQIQSESCSDVVAIWLYGFLISKCNHVVKLDLQEIIDFFDQYFTEDSSPEIILTCLCSIDIIITNCFDYAKEFLTYYAERILTCTLSDIKEVRSQAFLILSNENFDIGSSFDDFVQFILDNKNQYFESNPIDFFVLLILCANLALPIPDSYYESLIDDELIPLAKSDLMYLKCLAGLIAANEYWIDPYIPLMDSFLETQIDECITEINSGNWDHNYDYDPIIDFYGILLLCYDDIIFQLQQNNLVKFCDLFYKIDVLDELHYKYLVDRLSPIFKFLNNTEESDKLNTFLFDYMVNSDFLSIYLLFYIYRFTIRYSSNHVLEMITNHLMHHIQINEDLLYIEPYFETLRSVFKNPQLTEDYALQIVQFLKEYCLDFNPNTKKYLNLFYSLGKIIHKLPDPEDMYHFLFSNYELFQRNTIILNDFFSFCILPNLYKGFLTTSFEVDDLVIDLAIYIFNDPLSSNDYKKDSILGISLMMEENRSEQAIQFFIDNLETFLQNASDQENPFHKQSAIILFNAANLNITEIDIDLLVQCCDYFPEIIDFELNKYLIRYTLLLIDDDNQNDYAQYLELSILNFYFNLLIKPYNKTRMIKIDQMKNVEQCFIKLADRNHDYVQQKIEELSDFPSSQKRIMKLLDKTDEQE